MRSRKIKSKRVKKLSQAKVRTRVTPMAQKKAVATLRRSQSLKTIVKRKNRQKNLPKKLRAEARNLKTKTLVLSRSLMIQRPRRKKKS